MNFDRIAQSIATATGQAFTLEHDRHVGGGCINTAMKISGSGQDYFLKLNDAKRLDMFEAEAEGLHDLAAAGAIKVPAAICTGVSGDQSFIVLEYLDLGGSARGVMAQMGEQLAHMHRHTAERFGWQRDNTIGATVQKNDWADDWVEFYAQSRLGFQIELAAQRGISSSTVDSTQRVMECLPQFFSGYTPVASILHGDLWSGNYGVTRAGQAVIFDPATYYGDREADLAMTELFGGFAQAFYEAYDEAWPIDPGYKVRKTLYNLYHIINHYNLFGGGYGSQAGSMASQLLAELR